MLKLASSIPEGSLVYITEEAEAFFKTPKGWKKILVGAIVIIPLIRAEFGTGFKRLWNYIIEFAFFPIQISG